MSTALRTQESARPWGGWPFVVLYAAAYAGAWLALLTPIMLTLALRVQELVPERAASSLSLVLSAGALFALVSNPVFGHLSDRTTSRWGMRRPWLVVGALGGAASLALVALAPSMAWVFVGWCLVQLSFNAVIAPLAALLPDQVPLERRGTVAGIVSITTPVGQIAGTWLTHLVPDSMSAMFLLPGLLGVAAILLLALTFPDRRGGLRELEPVRWATVLGSFWISPRRYADFAYIWAGRFFVMVGMALMLAYQPFYLMTKLHVAARDVPDVVFQSTRVQCLLTIVAGLASGKLSDMARRRKPFVIWAAVLYAAGALLIVFADSFTTFLAGMALSGVGLGTYLSVDFAFVTDALPDKEHGAAKDLGVFNIANTLPQFVAPLAASVALATSGGSYTTIYVMVVVAGVIASLVIVPVRGVR